ncbi:MAG: UDP-N-acetylglucosamine 2-epimerase [Candidatus Omnitrophota bacterium]|jgi:UDP-N-acetylglucosamine 2-epimerase
MIHIAIGTKAQVVKMAPVLWRLKEKNIPYNLIDLGQHALITKELRAEFSLPEPAVYVSAGKNISSVLQAFCWLSKIGLKSLSSRWIKKEVFHDQGGVCLIHGDTLSTLLGLYLAKRAGLAVAHIEAGLRSFCWQEPFPEEIVRIIAMKYSHILFAPSMWAYQNLAGMGLENKSVAMPANTSFETARFSFEKNRDSGKQARGYCLVTFHRIENIFSKRRLVFILDTIERISMQMPVVFVRHQSTARQLRKKGLWQRLSGMHNIKSCSLLSHKQFMLSLEQCAYVLTDGGSIQEEAYYLGKPCLLLRSHTERNEGLGENVVLSCFDKAIVDSFITGYSAFKRENKLTQPLPLTASAAIVERLREYA